MRRTLSRSQATVPALLLVVGIFFCGKSALAQSTPGCWVLFNQAMRHRAIAPHPPFIVYNEHISVIEDDSQVLDTSAKIEYREDGLARVIDDRYDGFQFLTYHEDPGPPELGPYGTARSLWLPLPDAPSDLRIIGDVLAKNPNGPTCTDLGVEQYKDHRVYHLAFGSPVHDRPTLQALWVDASSQEIWKVALTGYINLASVDDSAQRRLTHFEVELTDVGRYLVVDHVTWHYRLREYDQFSNLFGEYYLSGFEFPQQLPGTTFSG